eukprot:GHVS01049120.1.p1 GENE.GHVS01049120.1~~GHVS01049120.1.p1  ORF type:complete len:310 (-),score=69.09 GHVS01049120.1:123-1052(-)
MTTSSVKLSLVNYIFCNIKNKNINHLFNKSIQSTTTSSIYNKNNNNNNSKIQTPTTVSSNNTPQFSHALSGRHLLTHLKTTTPTRCFSSVAPSPPSTTSPPPPSVGTPTTATTPTTGSTPTVTTPTTTTTNSGRTTTTTTSLTSAGAVHHRILSSLQRIRLLSRKRNSFEQLFLPHVKLQEVLNHGTTAIFSCPVTQEMCHYEGILHTGQLCAIVSNLSALHTSCVDPKHRVVLTVELNLSFLNKCTVGEEITATSTIISLSHRTATADIKIHNMADKPLLAAARHSMKLSGQAAEFQKDVAEGGCDFM